MGPVGSQPARALEGCRVGVLMIDQLRICEIALLDPRDVRVTGGAVSDS